MIQQDRPFLGFFFGCAGVPPLPLLVFVFVIVFVVVVV